MATEIELLTEVRDLLLVLAEPLIAERDAKPRKAIRGIVGNGKAKASAVLLMDGSRNQAAIIKESGIDQGALSRLTKALREARLIAANGKNPKLSINLPPNFFENGNDEDE